MCMKRSKLSVKQRVPLLLSACFGEVPPHNRYYFYARIRVSSRIIVLFEMSPRQLGRISSLEANDQPAYAATPLVDCGLTLQHYLY
jgi:hypothetical protein